MKENINNDVSKDAHINNRSNSCLNINNFFQKALSRHAMPWNIIFNISKSDPVILDLLFCIL